MPGSEPSEPTPAEGPPDDEQLADSLLDVGIANYFASTADGATETRAVPDDAAPEAVGDYRILRRIGRGAMGDVYLAEDRRLTRRVALKILKPALTTNPDAIARFRIEATSAARLHHPGIVQIFDIGDAEGIHFIAMELVQGSPLHEVIRQLRAEGLPALDGSRVGRAVSLATLEFVGGSAPRNAARPATEAQPSRPAEWHHSYIETACRLVIQVADALQHAHDAGVIHRDVKPSNILVLEDGSAVLTDFGLACADDLPGVTKQDMYIGTPHYSSPEQAQARRDAIDHRTDIFSLGVTLYELLTLRLPFEGSTSLEVLDKIRQFDPPNPRRLNRKLPRDLVTILLTALEKDRETRYATAADFAADLRAMLAMQPIAARRSSLLARAGKLLRRRPRSSAAAAGLALAVGIWAAIPAPRIGTLQFAARPGITVFVDGRPTPADSQHRITVAAGDHQLRLEDAAALRSSQPFPVTVAAGDTVPVDRELHDVWPALQSPDQAIPVPLHQLSAGFQQTLLERLTGVAEQDRFVQWAERSDPAAAHRRIAHLAALGGSTGAPSRVLEAARRLRAAADAAVTTVEAALAELPAERPWPAADRRRFADLIENLNELAEGWTGRWQQAVRALPGAPSRAFDHGTRRGAELRQRLEQHLLAKLADHPEAKPPAQAQLLAMLRPDHPRRASLVGRLLARMQHAAERPDAVPDAALADLAAVAEVLHLDAGRSEVQAIRSAVATHQRTRRIEALLAGAADAFEAGWTADRLPADDALGELDAAQRAAIAAARKFLIDAHSLRSHCQAADFAAARAVLTRLQNTPLDPRFAGARPAKIKELAAQVQTAETRWADAQLQAAAKRLAERAPDDARRILAEFERRRITGFESRLQALQAGLARLEWQLADARAEQATSAFLAGLAAHPAASPQLQKLHQTLELTCRAALDAGERWPDPSDADRTRMARLLLRTGQPRAARERLRGVNPRDPGAMLLTGQAWYCEWLEKVDDPKPLQSALQWFEQAASQQADPDSFRADYWAGISLLHLSEHDRPPEATRQERILAAQRHLGRALQRLDYPHARHQLAVAWLDRGASTADRKARLEYMGNAVGAVSKMQHPPRLSEDEVLAVFGRHGEAAAKGIGKLAAEIHVAHAHAQHWLARIQQPAAGRTAAFQASRDSCTAALQLAADHFYALYFRCYARIELDPSDPDIAADLDRLQKLAPTGEPHKLVNALLSKWTKRRGT